MEIKISAKNIKLTPAIKEFTETRVNKIEGYVDNVVWAQVHFSVEKKINQRAEIILHVGPKQTLKANAVEDDLYKAIDAVAHKIEMQLRKVKSKKLSKRTRAEKEQSIQFIDYAFVQQPEVRFSVIKQVEVRPMAPEDAAYEMEKIGYTFWMFLDKDSRQLNLIFKRLDGSYGLIRPIKK